MSPASRSASRAASQSGCSSPRAGASAAASCVQVFAGVVDVHDRGGFGHDRGGQVPDPGRAVAEHDELADAVGAAAAGFGVHQGGELGGGREAAHVAGGVGVAHRAALLVEPGLVNRQASLTSRVRARPSALLPAPRRRRRHHRHSGAVDGDVELVRRLAAPAAGAGSTPTRPCAIAADSAARRSAAPPPSISAERSIRLVDNRIPASSASRSPAVANGSAAAARATIERRPGDSDAPATPSSPSRGTIPRLHTAQ